MKKISWDSFQTRKYVSDNYETIHDEDKHIIDILIPYISSNSSEIGSVIDVGCGPNLYPTLLVLPYASHVDLVDISRSNTEYVTLQIHSPDEPWISFWKYFQTKDTAYVNCDLGKHINHIVHPIQNSIFDLRESAYDSAFMFFVAESMSDKYAVFEKACRKFCRSVKSGGLLIAAFMEHSEGYEVNDISYPAVSIGKEDLEKVFNPIVTHLKIHHIPKAQPPLRSGYSGMLLLTARRR